MIYVIIVFGNEKKRNSICLFVYLKEWEEINFTCQPVDIWSKSSVVGVARSDGNAWKVSGDSIVLSSHLPLVLSFFTLELVHEQETSWLGLGLPQGLIMSSPIEYSGYHLSYFTLFSSFAEKYTYPVFTIACHLSGFDIDCNRMMVNSLYVVRKYFFFFPIRSY